MPVARAKNSRGWVTDSPNLAGWVCQWPLKRQMV